MPSQEHQQQYLVLGNIPWGVHARYSTIESLIHDYLFSRNTLTLFYEQSWNPYASVPDVKPMFLNLILLYIQTSKLAQRQ